MITKLLVFLFVLSCLQVIKTLFWLFVTYKSDTYSYKYRKYESLINMGAISYIITILSCGFLI